MRICPECGAGALEGGWHCSACGWRAATNVGIPVLAPALDGLATSYEEEAFAPLAELEEGNYWFENRNRLISQVVRRYFPGAENFLEVGCGNGFVLLGLSREHPEMDLHGVDVFSAPLRTVQDRVPGCTVAQMDAHWLPYEDEFDVVGAFDVLEHLEDDESVMRRMIRAVHPGGGLIITVPQHPFLWSETDDFACHQRRYTREELRAKLTSAGGDIVHVTSFVSLLFPLLVASRMLPRRRHDPLGDLDVPDPINRSLAAVLSLERFLLGMGARFPFGGSLLAVARVPGR